MKREFLCLCGALLFCASFFVACSLEPEVEPIPENYTRKERTNRTIDKKYQYYELKDSVNTVFWEDFEGDHLTSKNPWSFKGAQLSSFMQLKQYLMGINKTYNAGQIEDTESQVVVLEVEPNKTNYIKYSDLNITEDCYLTFRFIYSGVKNTGFRIVLNGNESIPVATGGYSSTGYEIITRSVKIHAGTNSISFETISNTTYSYVDLPNAAYIDDISLVYDKVASIVVTPRSNQKTYVNCAENERIKTSACAIRADGTIVEGKSISLSSSYGTIDSEGYFTPTQSGSGKIIASCDGITGESGLITIDSVYSVPKTVTIAGVTYNGTISDNGQPLTAQNPRYSNYNARIDFEYPKTNAVTADGFVRIKGKLTQSTLSFIDKNKVLIRVVSGKDDRATLYYCDKDFDVNIWLPFGGEQTIIIGAASYEYYTYEDDNGNVCEGDIKKYSYMNDYTIKVTNRHSHSVANDGSKDGRYVYPSILCQSDNYLIQNVTNEALYGLSENASAEEKFEAIHEYIVLNLHYDYDSVANKGMRKKQDAVSVLKNRTGVCEGYANLTAAMARYAGIPALVIISNQLNHAWNHVDIDGRWLFCDTTWDDPMRESDSAYVSYNYFLLTDFDGLYDSGKNKKDHAASDKYIDNRQAALEMEGFDEVSVFYKDGYMF